MENYEVFRKIMQDYIVLLDRITDIEKEKVEVIAEGTLDALDKCIRQEEAEMLRMRGLDSKREKTAAQMGLEGKTFGQIVDIADGDRKDELKAVYEELKEKTTNLRQLSQSTSDMIESRLSRIESTISASGSQAAYNKDGEIVYDGNRSRMRPTSV